MREIMEPVLAERTSIHLGGKAIAELILEHEDDLALLPSRLKSLGGTPLVLGAGSNILAQDGNLPLVIIRPRFMDAPTIMGRQEDRTLVRVGAGVFLLKLLRFCAAEGLTGLEGLMGIPASVGGAIKMNAGSFGCEICKNIVSIQVVSNGDVRTIPAAALHSSYRSLYIEEENRDFIVLNAIFGLTHGSKDGISTLMRHNFFEKKSKQPVTAWSAGCTFKNPSPEMPAGKALDLAGFKGRKLGGMAFSEKHANFLINEGKGTAQAALALMQEARDAVQRQFGYTLEPEVRIVPCCPV